MFGFTTAFDSAALEAIARKGNAAGRETSAAHAAVGGKRAEAGAVRLSGVEKTYQAKSGAVTALEGIDLHIEAGTIHGIIGRSGAGKSTLIRLLNRLEAPTGGQVLVDGEDIARLDTNGLVALRRRVGMIFQHFNLLSAKTVFDNVALPLVVAGVPRAEIGPRVEKVLALVGLADKHRVHPSRLSGGQKQRVGIARALVSDPRILLCDEATSALDPETTLSILTLLKDINRRLGLTIVLITHEMSVIREICDNVLVLEGGRIAESGPVWQVFGSPRHEATRALLAPLTRGLPDDLAERLRTERGHPSDEAVIELHYSGEGAEPDLGRIAERLAAPLRLLHAGIDRVQGRSHGRLLVAARGIDPTPQALSGLAEDAKVIGYVPRNA